MLKLARNDGESVVISLRDGIDPAMTVAELFSGGPITITVRGRRTMLVIEAPDQLHILREELVNSNRSPSETVS